MGDEFIEEIDWNRNIIAIQPKSLLKERMFPHKVSLVLPRSDEGGFIISKRARDQYPWPDTWVPAVGGKVIAGESFEDAAIREMKEEIGIICKIQKIAEVIYDDETYKAIFEIFTTKEPIKIDSLKPDPREIQTFRSLSIKELDDEINKNPERFAGTFKAAAREFIKNINN